MASSSRRGTASAFLNVGVHLAHTAVGRMRRGWRMRVMDIMARRRHVSRRVEDDAIESDESRNIMVDGFFVGVERRSGGRGVRGLSGSSVASWRRFIASLGI